MELQELLEHVLENVKNGEEVSKGLLRDGLPVSAYPYLGCHDKYSKQPKTHIVNGFTVPAPVDSLDECNEVFYFPVHWRDTERYDCYRFYNESVLTLFKNKQIFATEEAAIANQKAQAFIDPEWGV